MTPTEQQKAILECRENLVVIAAPGSGKTFVLSEKIKNDFGKICSKGENFKECSR